MWNWRNPTLALKFTNNFNNTRYLSNKSAWITSIKRKLYLRRYPTLLVQPDGSTLTIRHFEPRKIIKLPMDITKLSEELQAKVLENRKPKRKVVIEKEVEVDFDSNQYIELIRRQKCSG